MRPRTRNVLAGALFIAAVIAALLVARRSGKGPVGSPDPKSGASGEAAEELRGAAFADRSSAPTETPAQLRTDAGAVVEARARLARDIAMARELRMRRQRAAAGSTESPAERPELEAGELDKDYIRDRVREIVPLVKECYDLARDQRPELAGKLTVHFTLAGEPEIGGIVESSEIDAEHSTISDPALSECLSESMYALEFEPPSGGGRVEVRYPFVFRTSAEE